MVKGTIECSFGEVKTNAELDPCKLLFAVGIHEAESNIGQVRHLSQCAIIGEGMNPPYVIECLGKSSCQC